MPKPSQAMRSTTRLTFEVSRLAWRARRFLVAMSGDLGHVTGRLPNQRPGRTLARAGAPSLVQLPLPPEDAERARKLANRPIGVAARPASRELLRPALDP